MYVYVLNRSLINWETAYNENCWWVYDSEDKAKKALQKELEEFYEEYGKEFSYSHFSEDGMMASLEINEEINFTLLVTEEPVF